MLPFLTLRGRNGSGLSRASDLVLLARITRLDLFKHQGYEAFGQLTKALAAASVHGQIQALPEQCMQDLSSLEDIF
jgi:hypothetical protein